MPTTVHARSFCVAFVMALVMAVVSELNAQGRRFGFQVRTGLSFLTAEREDTRLKTGFGFDFTGSYRFVQDISCYAGWGWNRFCSERSFAGPHIDFEDTSYTFGLMFLQPFPHDLPFAYFLKAGAIYSHIELEDADGDMVSDSGHGFGFQVETRLSFSQGESWPYSGIKYQTLSHDLQTERSAYRIFNYLSAGATLSPAL